MSPLLILTRVECELSWRSSKRTSDLQQGRQGAVLCCVTSTLAYTHQTHRQQVHKHTRQHSINIQQNIHKIRTPYCYHTQQVRYHMHVHVDYHQLLDGYMQPYTQHGLSDRYAFTISSRSTYSHLSCNGHLSASTDLNRQKFWRKKKKAVQ